MGAGRVDRTDSNGGDGITLVVPVRNEVSAIPGLVRSIERQTRPPDQVIIVDGGSTDGTASRVRAVSEGDPRFVIVEAGDATPGAGRNEGIRRATFKWIALTDGGIELDAAWLEHLEARGPNADVVYGGFDPFPGSLFERCAALAYVPPRGPESGSRGPSVASALLRKTVWESVGGFPDLRAAEDLIFMERADASSARIRYAPLARLWWHIQPNLRRTFARFRQFSNINVRAGRQRDWHYGVARQYLLATPFVVLGWRDHRWLLAPVGGLIARVVKSVWVRRDGRGFWWTANPIRLGLVTVVIVTVDVATFVGWAEALREQRRSRRSRCAA
jgi:glycosyltransferase involved in cell wall biosynthesis